MVFVPWYCTTMGDMLMSTLHLYGQVSCWGLLSILRVCAGSNAAAKPATLAGITAVCDRWHWACDRPGSHTPASWCIVRVIEVFYCLDFVVQIMSSVCVVHGRTLEIIILCLGPMGSVGAL